MKERTEGKMISSIYNCANDDPPVGAEADRRNAEAFANAWQRMGLIVLYPDQVVSDWDRQAVINVATRLYGPRERT